MHGEGESTAKTTATPSEPTSVDHAHRHGQIAQAVRATGGVTMLSRVGGLVRDVIIGRMFGDTAVGSAFAFAFALPNMFRRLFGEGALSAAFVPEYSEAVREEGPGTGRAGGADQLASLTVMALGVVTGLITAVIELALLLVLLLGHHDFERALSIKLVMVMLPFMPLICCVAVLAGMLQVHGKYGAAASGPLVLNAFIVCVGGYLILTGKHGGEWSAMAVGVATVLSGLTQALWFAKLLKPHVRWTKEFAGARERARAMLKRFVPVALGLGTLQLNTLLDSVIAMWPIWVGATLLGYAYPLDKQSNVILSLTARIYQFPLGVFGIAVATAVFPLLAMHAKEPAHFLDTLRRGMRLSLFVGVPASVGLVLVRHDAIGVLFGGRKGWSDESVARGAAVLAGFAMGVWAYGLNHVLTRAMYAKKDTTTPMRVAMAMVALNLALNWTLIWWLREAGLAVATSASAIVQCAVLALLVRRMIRREEGMVHATLVDGELSRGVLKVLGASAVMALAVLGVQWGLSQGVPGLALGPWSGQLLRLVVSVSAGGAVFLAASMALRVHELRWLMHRPARRAAQPGSSSDADAQAAVDP